MITSLAPPRSVFSRWSEEHVCLFKLPVFLHVLFMEKLSPFFHGTCSWKILEVTPFSLFFSWKNCPEWMNEWMKGNEPQKKPTKKKKKKHEKKNMIVGHGLPRLEGVWSPWQTKSLGLTTKKAQRLEGGLSTHEFPTFRNLPSGKLT